MTGAVETTASNLPFQVRCDPLMDDALAAEWDALLAISDANLVFLTSGWLRAWHETLGRDTVVRFAQVRHHGSLVAAAAFQISDGVVQFAGTGPSDYSDFIVRTDLDDTQRRDVTNKLLQSARCEGSSFTHFKLGRLLPDSRH